MIQSFRAEELQGLLADGPGPRVSLYLPTHRRHPEWKQDPVRFRGLVGSAESQIETRFGSRDAKALLEPLRRFEAEADWGHSLDGLALFHREGSTVAYRLPIPVPELAVVAETYHTKPLLRYLHSNQRYLVLAISQNAVSLYEGSRYGAGAVNLHGVPGSFRGAVGIPDHERSFTSSGGWGQGGVFHGQGPGKEKKKEELARYFQAIDRGLHEYLHAERVPLLLAAVKYYHPLYREANTYAHLIETGLDGNFERATHDQIHAEAWPIVSRLFESQIQARSERFRERAGTGLASDRIEEVAVAAVEGRVQCVLVAEGEQAWGTLDRKTGAIAQHDRHEGGDLLDDIGEESLKKGGEVYVVERASMPTSSPIAAVYRF